MQEWWNNLPEAGPKEPGNSSPCGQPTLSLTSWEGELPTLPEVVVCKFDGDETYGGKWGGKVATLGDCVNSSIGPIASRADLFLMVVEATLGLELFRRIAQT